MGDDDQAELLGAFATTDPWASVSTSDLPPALVDAVERKDWGRAKSELVEVMDGLSTDGVYGRALLQLVQKIPIGLDPVTDRHRAAIAIDHGHWDDLRRCLEAGAYASSELDRFREALLRSVNQLQGRPIESPLEAPFIAYEFQLSGRWGWYKQWAKRLPSFDAQSRFSRPDLPAGRHFRFRMLHHAVLTSSGEAQGGRLPTAAALAGEGREMGDAGEPLRDIASDLEVLTLLAMGDAPERPLRLAARATSPRGMSPLGTLEWLLHVMPFLTLMKEDWLTPAAKLMQRIASGLGSPKAQLVANTWVAAAQVGATDSPPRRTELPAVMTSASHADVGLRVLPQLLSARVSGRYSEFQDAERLARIAGNVWAQVSALVWMVALDPSPRAGRQLVRLLVSSGWRRPVLVPQAVLSDAVLGLTSLGMRDQSLIELALASGRQITATEVARRHTVDVGLNSELRLLGVEALSKIGTTHARTLLAEAGAAPDEIGSAARGLVARAPKIAGLTAREVEVLNLAGQGLTNRQIADHLSLSHHTIARHLSNARDKLGAANRVDAAVRLGKMRPT